MESVGKRLKSLRENLGLSQLALAEKFGKSQVAISKYENENRELDYDMLKKYSDFFHVSTDYILGRVDHPSDYVLDSENYPNIIKPLVKSTSGSKIVLSIDKAQGYITPEELADLLVDEMKQTPVYFDQNEKNPITELMSLIPETLQSQQMSLYDAIEYIVNNPDIMRQLQESGYNKNGELCISPDAFNRAVLSKIIKDSLLKKNSFNNKERINKNSPIPSGLFPYTPGRKVPIVGSIPAGSPVLAQENIEGYDYADVPQDGEYFYLRVEGNSMVNANILDGSLVLVKSQPCAENGQIVVCLVNGDEATLKRFYKQNDLVILKPENPAYQPIIVSCKDFDNGYARILGVAIEAKFKL